MNDEAVQALKELLAVVEVAGIALVHPRSRYVDWDELYSSDHNTEDWIAEPLFPAGRQCVVYAPAKAGKSLIVLDVVTSVAAGKPILGRNNKAGRRHVLYLDYEMTGADLLERLTEMGYEPGDLTHLHYALLPIIPALNTPDGAKIVREMAAECDAELVVIDTLSRAVEGDINAPNTVSDFYTWTGLALKADGRALVRLDHEGKDAAKGMIGSSMKATDVDLVWHLKRMDDGLLLTRKYTRIMWGEESVSVTVKRDPLRHVIGPRLEAAGTSEYVLRLDELGLSASISVREATAALRAAGGTVSNEPLRDALRRRRDREGVDAYVNQHSAVPKSVRHTSIDTANGTAHGTAPENALTCTAQQTAQHGTADLSGVPSVRLPRDGTPAPTAPDDPFDDF